MEEALLKEQLLKHLKGGEAFTPVSELLDKISFKKSGKRPLGLPYSFYEVFYHMVYAQKDILDFCIAEEYNMPSWPKDYWPGSNTTATKEEWQALQQQFYTDQEALREFIGSTDLSLLDTPKHGKEQTIVRELALVLEHNAYHTGQLAIILRLLGLL